MPLASEEALVEEPPSGTAASVETTLEMIEALRASVVLTLKGEMPLETAASGGATLVETEALRKKKPCRSGALGDSGFCGNDARCSVG